MKRLVLFLTFVFALIFYASISISAMQPLPEAVASRTSFPGIIPITDNNLEVSNLKYELDFFSSNLEVKRNIERSAKVTLNYEINNPSDLSTVKFTLPFLSKFSYIQNEILVKVNDKKVDADLNFIFFDADYIEDSFSEYLLEFSSDKYLNSAARNYEFENDMDGYLYILTNPKTKSSKFKAGTDIVFYNVPNDTFFVDGHSIGLIENNNQVISGTKFYDSEEVSTFFVSKDLETDIVTKEWEEIGGAYTSDGTLLDPATITKEPIKLSDYIKTYDLRNNYTIYTDAYEKYIYKVVDDFLKDEYTNNWINLKYYSDYFINERYHGFGLEFAVEFASNSKTTIEITYEIPIFCDYTNKYKESEMILDFINNPGGLWSNILNTEVIIKTDEIVKEADIDYESDNKEYRFSFNDSNKKSIILNNSKYRGCHSKYGCGSLLSINSLYLGLILIVFIYIRRKKS